MTRGVGAGCVRGGGGRGFYMDVQDFGDEGRDGSVGSGGSFGFAALEVEGEEALEDFGVGEVGGPAVGGGDGGVQVGMDVGEPGGALVVEVGQGAFLEIIGVEGRVAVGVDGVEPALAELVEAGGHPHPCYRLL